MKPEWQKLLFDEVIADESGGNARTLQSDYLPEGRFAVVDQGQSSVAGYVDDPNRLCRTEPPVIIFGDHTRCFKFVDFPFCIGAEGVKVLRSKVEANPKYLFYYLRQLRLPDDGYSRHFKYLRRSEIILPPLFEQRRIATILDRADALRAKRRAAIAQLDTLAQSIFLDMFGDRATNPKGWADATFLGEVADIVSGVTKGRKLFGKKTRTVPYLAVVNVQDKAIDLTVLKTIEATEEEIARYRLLPNDLLLTEGGDPDKLGRGSLWANELPECIHQNHVFRVRLCAPAIDPVFLNWLVGSRRGKAYFLRSAKQTTGIASINMTQLRAFPLLIPPIEVQREFGKRVNKVEELKVRQSNSLAHLDSLFASLQHRAFRGEL